MNKNEFLRALEKGIAGLTEEERRRTLDFFSEMVDERLEEGMSEEEAVASIGSVDEIIENVLAEVPAAPVSDKGSSEMRRIITENFSSVSINDINRDVNIHTVPEKNCCVEYKEIPGLDTEIKVQNGCLRIETKDNRRWFERLKINFSGKGKLNLYLPAGKYTEVKAHTVNGDVRFGAVQANTVRATTVNGDISLSNVGCDELHISTTNGDVKLEGDARELHISTVNGDIKGKLRTGKVFHVNTVVGDIKVPADDPSGGVAHVSTVSGDINIKIKG